MLTPDERVTLETEWKELQVKLKGDFVNPKDMRRSDEITSLLVTDGGSGNIKLNFVRGRGYSKGLNATKPYNRKGRVG